MLSLPPDASILPSGRNDTAQDVLLMAETVSNLLPRGCIEDLQLACGIPGREEPAISVEGQATDE